MVLFIVFILLGAFLGALEGNPFAGGAIGFLVAWVNQLSNKVHELKRQLEQNSSVNEYEQPLAEMAAHSNHPQQADWLSDQGKPLENTDTSPSVELAASDTDKASQARDNVWAQAAHDKANAQQTAKESKPTLLSKVFTATKDWFIGGNPFVRAGIVLLFTGVVFLLRYSLEKGLIPVELRLAGAAATALALLFFGWRLRHRAGAYGLILQAGGIGLLYLTVFGALSLYGLIAAPVAFALLVVIVAAGVVLAVLQNSLPLAMFATAGGFLAPLLTSTGSNNYIGLFSFYALLNIGIVCIAWFKSWRLLNLLGFVFTFVVASIWGASSYQPAYFSTTAPFLVLFFLLYVAVAVLFATRTPVNYKDSVDSTLVFGVPVIGFCMLVALVKDFEYGVAISSLILGLFYLLLSKVLLKRYGQAQKLLVETFISLGVIFATLSIPFAVDGALTSATWAIEGIGILWVSIRQQQWLRRAFAILLHFAALVALLLQAFINLFSSAQVEAFANGDFVALLLITISMLICSRMLSRDFEGKKSYESGIATAFFFLAIGLQWCAFEWEVIRFELLDEVAPLHLIYAIVVSALLCVSTRFNVWRLVKYIVPFPFFLMIISGLKTIELASSFAFGSGIYLWPIALSTLVLALRQLQKQERFVNVVSVMHALLFWLVAILLTHEVHYWVSTTLGFDSAWYLASLPLIGLSAIWLILRSNLWPIKDFRPMLVKSVAVPFVGLAGLWVIASLSSAGHATPLPWIPVLNPLDIVVAITGLTLYALYRQLNVGSAKGNAEFVRYGSILLLFMAINITVLRVLHHYYGYAWQFPSLLDQPVTQTTLAIVWTLFGMVLALFGNRVLNRKLWFAGAALLGLVVLKLFLVDFASSGTVARIISFISVGGLLLFIGYLAPMPSTTKLEADLKEDAQNV